MPHPWFVLITLPLGGAEEGAINISELQDTLHRPCSLSAL